MQTVYEQFPERSKTFLTMVLMDLCERSARESPPPPPSHLPHITFVCWTIPIRPAGMPARRPHATKSGNRNLVKVDVAHFLGPLESHSTFDVPLPVRVALPSLRNAPEFLPYRLQNGVQPRSRLAGREILSGIIEHHRFQLSPIPYISFYIESKSDSTENGVRPVKIPVPHFSTFSSGL